MAAKKKTAKTAKRTTKSIKRGAGKTAKKPTKRTPKKAVAE